MFKMSHPWILIIWWIAIHFVYFFFQGPLVVVIIILRLTAVKNTIISWVLNFRVCVLLEGAVTTESIKVPVVDYIIIFY